MSTHELSLDDFLEHHAQDSIYSDMTVEEYFQHMGSNPDFLELDNEDAESLAHYGVKGMRWGVRKADGEGRSTSTVGSVKGGVRVGPRFGGNTRPSGLDKLSARYNATKVGKVTNTITRATNSIGGAALGAALSGPAAPAVLVRHTVKAVWANKDNVRRINNKPEYKGKNLKTNPELRKKYHAEQMAALKSALVDPRGMRLAETKLRVSGKAGSRTLIVTGKDLKHAEGDVVIDVEYDDLGHIVEMKVREPLKHTTLEETDISDEALDFLAHWGVKGMKWGVRKDRTGVIRDFNKNSRSQTGTVDASRRKRAVATMYGPVRPAFRALNKKYAGKDLTKNPKLRKKYDDEVKLVIDHSYKRGVMVLGVSTVARVTVPPVLSSAVIVGLRLGNRAAAKAEVLSHADDIVEIRLHLVRDKMGLVVDMAMDDADIEKLEALEHSSNFGDFLAHWGVKGMKWGVRKDRTGVGASSASASEDHINVAALRKKKLSQLSNAEIKAVNERMNLEKKYREMNPSDHELLMRKLKKRTDTARKILKWLAGPEGGAILKAMGLDGKSRRADAKAKEQAAAEKRKAEAKAKAEKKAAKKAEKAKKAKKAKKTWYGIDENGVPFTVRR